MTIGRGFLALLVAGASALILATYPPAGQPLGARPIITTNLAPGTAMPVHVTGGAIHNPAGLLDLGNGKLLVANYWTVHLFDPATGKLSKTTVDMGDVPGKFMPTNFTMVPDTNHIFIANYQGNDILEAEYDEAANHLTVLRRIGDDRTISPEGIAYSDGMLANADYDGNNVQVFRKKDGKWQAICDLDVPLAHGVAFAGGYLYATNLSNPKLRKIDPVACKVLAETGSIGWKPGQFLWPTGIAAYGKHAVLVSDAHTGLITAFRASDLKLIGAYGGSGPGKTGLNMPYAVAAANGGFWVTSTFGDRFVRISATTGRADTWNLGKAWTQSFPPTAFLNNQPHDAGYVYERTGMTMTIGGRCYHPAYGWIVTCDGKDKVRIPSFFLQFAKAKQGYFITSPEWDTVRYVSGSLSTTHTFKVGFDQWVYDGRIIGPEGALDMVGLEKKALDLLKARPEAGSPATATDLTTE